MSKLSVRFCSFLQLCRNSNCLAHVSCFLTWSDFKILLHNRVSNVAASCRSMHCRKLQTPRQKFFCDSCRNYCLKCLTVTADTLIFFLAYCYFIIHFVLVIKTVYFKKACPDGSISPVDSNVTTSPTSRFRSIKCSRNQEFFRWHLINMV